MDWLSMVLNLTASSVCTVCRPGDQCEQCEQPLVSSSMHVRTLVSFLVIISGISGRLPADDAGMDFFEKRIRPMLIERCLECHGESDSPDGGLRLDLRAGWQTGGDSGPAIIPGNPESSLLLNALHYRDRVQMPPDGRLPEQVIRDFELWIRNGATDPRDGSISDRPSGMIDWEQALTHWSYQQPVQSGLPDVSDSAWPAIEVDYFILAELEKAGLRPVSDASREVLIRRVFYDLTGLPPGAADIDAFLADASPDAYERLVDRLLCSREFAEHWGRHWLDITRYGESVTLRGLIFNNAWRYRDYVIESFAADRPLNQMIREHIAGDLLPADSVQEQQRQLTATTFLALGNTNLEEQDKRQLRMDVVDEQLEAVGRAFLAQTIGCARCHDHKFDPIPTRDYYAMAGIFRNVQTLVDANVSNWIERPLPLSEDGEAAFRGIEQERESLQRRITLLRDQLIPADVNARVVLTASQVPGIVLDDTQAKRVGEWQESQHSGRYIGRGYLHDQNRGQGQKTLTFLPLIEHAGRYEVRLAYSADSNRASNTPVTVLSADGEASLLVNQRKRPPIDGRFISLGVFRFERGGQSYVIVSNESADGHVVVDAVQWMPEGEAAATQSDAGESSHHAATAADLKRLEQELKRQQDQHPPRPAVMSVREMDLIEETTVHIRGSVHNPGEPVTRGFLQAATSEFGVTFSDTESGRRELADWIVSPDNPLTARVMVNRLWHWLFGEGIVRTTDNFGTSGEHPSHPQLLDFLAVQLQRDGWSSRQFLRRLVLSRTYRLSSEATEELTSADPENRLRGRASRRVLSAESLRDSMLLISGLLEPCHGGNTIRPGTRADYGYEHYERWRSIYAPAFRNALPEMFELFDFADPSVVTGNRAETITSAQALWLMNHPFVQQQVRAATERMLQEAADPDERIDWLFRRIPGRLPADSEREICHEVLSAEGPAGWEMLVHSLLCSLDFRYVD